jgi:hypothetical protein
MGQGPRDVAGLSVIQDQHIASKHLIVDTGASHILFRKEDSSLLSNVQ